MLSKCSGLQCFKCPASRHAELQEKLVKIHGMSPLRFVNSWPERQQKDRGLEWGLLKVTSSALGSESEKWSAWVTVLPLYKCVWAFRYCWSVLCLALVFLTGKVRESDYSSVARTWPMEGNVSWHYLQKNIVATNRGYRENTVIEEYKIQSTPLVYGVVV